MLISESKKRQGWAAIGVLVVSAAIAPVFIRFAQAEGVPSLSIIIWRLILAALLLTPFAWQRHGNAIRSMTREDWIWTSFAGFFHAVGLVCLFFALENTTIFVNGVLRRTSPLWTIILEIAILSATFNRRVWIGVFVTLIGSLVIVVGGVDEIDVGARPLLGAGLSLLNALTLSIYIIIGRRARQKLPFLAYSWVLFSAAGVSAIVFGVVTKTAVFGFTPMGYVWIVVITLVAQVIGHLSVNFSVRIFPATYVAILLQMSVVISGIVAYIYFGEIPTIWSLVGSVIIVAGVTMLRGDG